MAKYVSLLEIGHAHVSLVKQVYKELHRLTEHGFDTWVSSLRKLADSYQLNAYVDPINFDTNVKLKCDRDFSINGQPIWTI